MPQALLSAQPDSIAIDPARAALLVIDMQRDFLLPGGFGAALGSDVSLLQAAVAPCQRALAAATDAGLRVVHTREGHRPDLADAPPAKLARESGQQAGIPRTRGSHCVLAPQACPAPRQSRPVR